MADIFINNQHKVDSIFELFGDKENDFTRSIAWVLGRSPILLKKFIEDIFKSTLNTDFELVKIAYQLYDSKTGITDLEITDNSSFYI